LKPRIGDFSVGLGRHEFGFKFWNETETGNTDKNGNFKVSFFGRFTGLKSFEGVTVSIFTFSRLDVLDLDFRTSINILTFSLGKLFQSREQVREWSVSVEGNYVSQEETI